MKNLIITLAILTSLTACTGKRYRDSKGVYVYTHKCVEGHYDTIVGTTTIGDVTVPTTTLIYTCDSSITVKTYLGK